MKNAPRSVVAVALAALAATSFAACSGDDTPSANPSADTDGDDVASPEEVLAYAKTLLDETSGVRIELSTDDDPDVDAVLKSASGVITDDPAFEGTADGRFMGFDASDVGIVSVDDTFYVDIPITGWQTFDPRDLCAPDPALLLDPDTGVGSVLLEAEDIEEGESERGGADNDEVLTVYTATLPNSAVKNVLPCAPGEEFDATFTITSDGYLRGAEITGEFFSGGGPVTYTIDVSEYDVEQEISAP